jgi:hypothetical protein
MKWRCLFGVLGAVTLVHASAPATPVKKAAAKPVTTSKAKKAIAGPATAKGKKTKGRATRKAAGPSYQLHPDPQRYAEIQRALTDRGYFHGESNGEWKDDSADALKRFQADQKLPDDGKISALTLTGLGLGPHHDGSTAATVPLPTTSASEPPVSGSTVGPASSATPRQDQPPPPALPAPPPPQ